MGSVLWFFFPHDKTSWADAFPHLSFFPTHCSSLLTSPCKILWGQLISEWCGLRNLLLFSLTWLFCFISDHFNPLTTTCCWCCNTLWCEMSLQWSTAPRPWGPLWWKRARSCGEEIRGCGKQNCEVQSSPRSLVKQTWEGSCDKWQRPCCCGAKAQTQLEANCGKARLGISGQTSNWADKKGYFFNTNPVFSSSQF